MCVADLISYRRSEETMHALLQKFHQLNDVQEDRGFVIPRALSTWCRLEHDLITSTKQQCVGHASDSDVSVSKQGWSAEEKGKCHFVYHSSNMPSTHTQLKCCAT